MNPIYILDPHLIPVGLEALVDVDHILIKQHIETLEFLKSIDAANKYSIMVPGEHLILHAEEHSNFFARNLIGKSRGFNLKVLSLEHKERSSTLEERGNAIYSAVAARNVWNTWK